MITCCPNCDYLVPMSTALAVETEVGLLVCPCCEKEFNPFAKDSEALDLEIEAIRDQLVISKSLQNTSRWFEDC